ncbi:MAG: carbohydrate kinase family protein [Planctomycetes bacterium]|nr:carbohydrate kinase family protein [Planctomycetota bacterium]
MARLIVAGYCSVEINVPPHDPPPPGGIRTSEAMSVDIGGSAVNTAIIAARLGVSTSLAGMLGDDVFGQMIKERLIQERVDVARLRLVPDVSSPTALVYHHATGQRSTLAHPGTNSEFKLPEQALTAPCMAFHLAAPERLEAVWPARITEIARQLKVARRTVSLDTCVMLRRGMRAKDLVREYRPVLELADIVFVNVEEAMLISGRKEWQSVARYFLERGVQIAVIKRGEKGAVVCWKGGVKKVTTSSVPKIDTYGAGDNFAAAFLAGYVRDLDPVKCTRLACAVATLSVTRRGPLLGSSNRDRVKKTLAEFELSV